MRQKNQNLVEFGFRLNLSLAFLSYGWAKLTDQMFSNQYANMGRMQLSQIDMFHLTWYWFEKNKQFSIFIGVLQIVAAIQLVINRTKVLGALVFLPIIAGIIMIDIFCVQQPGLYIRVVYYLCVCLALLVINRDRVLPIINYKVERRILIHKPNPGRSTPFVWILIGFLSSSLIEFSVAGIYQWIGRHH